MKSRSRIMAVKVIQRAQYQRPFVVVEHAFQCNHAQCCCRGRALILPLETALSLLHTAQYCCAKERDVTTLKGMTHFSM